MVNIHIKDLSIELTRWCQQQCMHCMRGPRENLFISEKIIDRFFYNPDYRIKYINFLLLTGGEPTLAAKQLKYLIDALEEQNVIVNTYRVVTNGLDYPEEFFDQLKRLDIRNDYIKSNSLVISTDQFHKKPSPEILQKYSNQRVEYKEEVITNILNFGLAK